MFIPRSARRIRLVRTAFLLGAVLPSVALAAWAVHRHSAAHRDAVRREWERAVGLPIAIAAVDHPLPGVVRARGCALAAADGRPVLEVADVRVESSPTEVRVGVGTLACDPAGAAELAGLAGEWLLRGARFRRDVVIDVEDFAWVVPGSAGSAERRPLGPVRIECVVQGGDRAVRVVRRAADAGADEVRIVRSATGPGAAGEGARIDIEGSCVEPLPFPIFAAVAPLRSVAALPFGPAATVRGRLTAGRVDGRWAGTASGRVEAADLAACTAALPAGAVGTLAIDVRGVEWRDGRLARCELACEAEAGRVDRRFLESLVATLGCRTGPAYVGATAERDAAFEAFGCGVRIDGRGIEITGSPRLGGALVATSGRSLLEPPLGIVSPERFAWLLAAPGAVYVPSSGPGAWLMSVLPQGGEPAGRTSRAGGDGRGF